MQTQIKTIDIELSQPVEDLNSLVDYSGVRALVRWHGSVVGTIDLPVRNGRLSGLILRQAIVEHLGRTLLDRQMRLALSSGHATPFHAHAFLKLQPPALPPETPSITVAVCTRNRVFDLARCLESLNQLDYPAFEILVVDNAPDNDSVERLVRGTYPNVRYVVEPRPGLNWARNRAILETTSDVLAFTDDDVVVDRLWLQALARIFAENPEVMAATGLVVPFELETKAQIFFEAHGGCGRGFKRRWVSSRNDGRDRYHAAWQFGSGANMAYRRILFDQIGYFDPALDVGTVANGGGDLEMFFRLIKEGKVLVYEPDAIVRHRHRRRYDQLRIQISNTGVGYFSFLVRSALAYPEEWRGFLRAAADRMWNWNVRRFLNSLVHPGPIPRDLILVEWVGSIVGLGRYQKARNTAVRIAHSMGRHTTAVAKRLSEPIGKLVKSMAVRTIDLSKPLQPITNVGDYDRVRFQIHWRERCLGEVEIAHFGGVISRSRLADAIVEKLGLRLLEPERQLNTELAWANALSVLSEHLLPRPEHAPKPEQLNHENAVSVVIVTSGNLPALKQCVESLRAQETERKLEILVVGSPDLLDQLAPNFSHPTPVRFVPETRPGVAYSRNAGFIASHGDIIVSLGEDMVAPSGWLESLLTPFAEPDVMVVTGNILPFEFQDECQRIWTRQTGFDRGPEPIIADASWIKRFRCSAVPAWVLGSGAHAAFRSTILSDPQIGLLEETLGSGEPTGCEESYLFYQVLRAGHKIIYQPSACVWHRPPSDFAALRRRVFLHCQGQIAFLLTTLIRDRDLGSLADLVFQLPRRWGTRCLRRLFGESRYPLSLLLAELTGYLAGPWALLRSCQTVQKHGRSGYYVPATQRRQPQWQDMVLSTNRAMSSVTKSSA